MRYLLVLLLLTGCAKRYWEKDGASQQDFQMDAGQCKAQAFGVPGALANTAQAAVVYNACMGGKGWYTVRR